MSLALKNLLSQKSRASLSVLAIGIGIAAFVLLTSLSNGIKQALITTLTSRSPLTQIIVRPPSDANNLFSMFTLKSHEGITPETVEAIKKLPHVTSASPELVYPSFSSLKINLLGRTFQTDAMIFGIPYEFIDDDLVDRWGDQAGAVWAVDKEPYPIIVSRRIFDLYNLTVAPTSNLPTFDEKTLIGLEISVLPNQSTFFPNEDANALSFKGKIVGFSDKVDLIGVSVPLDFVTSLVQDHDPSLPITYRKLFVEVDAPYNVGMVRTLLEGMGLQTSSSQTDISVLEQNFTLIGLGLSTISGIVLIVAGLMIATTFIATVRERRREIGLLRTLGATRRTIAFLFLTEAALIGLGGGVLGVTIGFISSIYLDPLLLAALPDLSLKPDTLFYQDWLVLLGAIVFSMILSMSFAFLPSWQASKLRPLQALEAA